MNIELTPEEVREMIIQLRFAEAEIRVRYDRADRYMNSDSIAAMERRAAANAALSAKLKGLK